MTKPASVFFSYSHTNKTLRDNLEKHLSVLKRNGHIGTWYDRKINPGSEVNLEIDAHLVTADLILLLISPDFLASDYCWSKEMTRAMERHEAGNAVVIPIILRPCDWHHTPFGKLKALPTDGHPVVSKHWKNSDSAFADVVAGIRQTIAGFGRPQQRDAPTAGTSRGDAAAGNVTLGRSIVEGQPAAAEPEGLQLEWFNGDVIGCDRFNGRSVSLIEVKNGTLEIPEPAFDLAAIVRYKSSGGPDFTVTAPVWWEVTRDSQTITQGWKPGIQRIESGQSQYFVLLARDDDGTEWAVRQSGDAVGQLDYARWELTIQVTSRNLPGLEWVISYLRRQYGGAPMPRVISKRILPARNA